MNDLVSIIMPVFNSEKFLENTIVSVLNQTHKNIELIIIDDHSTDSSIEIIKKFKKTDSRIKTIFFCKNRGVAAARNAGLKIANGNYITFIDSDDSYSSNNFFEQLFLNIDASIDLYVFPLRRTKIANGCKEFFGNYELKNEIIETTSFDFFKMAYSNYLQPSACNKLFLKKIILENNLTFPEGVKLSEDESFVALYLFQCKKILIKSGIYYDYNIHGDSAVRSSYEDSFLKTNGTKNFNYMYKNLIKILSLKDTYECLNIMIFNKRFRSIFKGYRNACKKISLRLPEEQKTNCRKYLNKQKMDWFDYCFAKSYFSKMYRSFIFPFITIKYYLTKKR